MNLYDLNKNIMNQLTPMEPNEINEKLNLFLEFQRKTMNLHYMLLCKDYNYYTIFEADNLMTFPTFDAAVAEIITNLGKVISIEKTEDAIEIWIIPNNEEDCFAFYLFPYDAGVVYYG